ncbi:MAG: RluA family pseudouridine synthase [Treponema sp.]|nr:RluA family pseudouridine synthase [Treponema sp.]
MFPPFPEEKAAKVLEALIHAIESGEVKIEHVARPSEERKNQGIMLGALVCTDKNGEEVNLVTNSGNARKLKMEIGKRKNGLLRFSHGDNDYVQSDESNIQDDKNNFQFSTFNFQFIDSIVSAKQIENALAENDAKIHELTKSREDDELREKLCAESLERVHALYKFHCIDGEVRSLKEICAEYNHGKLPPTGTGDCCAPKLLDYAFAHELLPISLAETRYTAPSGSVCSPEVAEGACDCSNERERRAEHATRDSGDRPNFQFSPFNFHLAPPCDERCGILLPAMLGLRILYRDEAICVVNKQSGVLSVPGRGEDKQDCIEARFRRLFGQAVEIAQPAVHRLDMETSGVMILAFTRAAHRELNRQFEAKEVEKEYVALLDGVLAKKGIAPHGEMELFFRLDVENRPHQIWDSENGKSAVTEWQILGVERYHAPDGSTRPATRVLFTPHTGRTHQLRLASADSHGFGTPIIGDTLYGHCDKGERLMLHAQKVTFTHPATGERMTIECAAEF